MAVERGKIALVGVERHELIMVIELSEAETASQASQRHMPANGVLGNVGELVHVTM